MKFPVLWLSFVSVWVGITGPHQLRSCQNLNLLKQINSKQTNNCGRPKGAAGQDIGAMYILTKNMIDLLMTSWFSLGYQHKKDELARFYFC